MPIPQRQTINPMTETNFLSVSALMERSWPAAANEPVGTVAGEGQASTVGGNVRLGRASGDGLAGDCRDPDIGPGSRFTGVKNGDAAAGIIDRAWQQVCPPVRAGQCVRDADDSFEQAGCIIGVSAGDK